MVSSTQFTNQLPEIGSSSARRFSTSLLTYFRWPVQCAVCALQVPLLPVIKGLFVSAAKEGQAVGLDYTSESLEVRQLKERLTFPCQAKLSNRLVKAGITDGLSTPHGDPSAKMVRAYQLYAQGGYGMMISPDTSVDRRSPLPAVLGPTPILDQKSDLAAFTRLAKAMKSNGATAIIQLTHPGSVVGYADRAVSLFPALADHPRGGFSQYAHVMQSHELENLKDRFCQAALLAQQSQFDGVQLVCSNDYLLAQLFSHHFFAEGNWNGAAFFQGLISRIVQTKAPDFVLGIKVNSEDFRSGGLTPAQGVEIVRVLMEQPGVDFVEIGGGNCEQLVCADIKGQGSQERESYFKEFAAPLLQQKKVPVMSTGEWRAVCLMEKAASEGQLIGLGRPVCIDPLIGSKILEGKLSRIPDWFAEQIPHWIRIKKEKGGAEGRRFTYTMEVLWHAVAASRVAAGETPPHVAHVLDHHERVLGFKLYMLVRAIVPRWALLPYYKTNPWAGMPVQTPQDKKQD